MNGFKRLWSGASGRKLWPNAGAAFRLASGIGAGAALAGCSEVNMEAGDWWLLAFCVGILVLCAVIYFIAQAADAEQRRKMTATQRQAERDRDYP